MAHPSADDSHVHQKRSQQKKQPNTKVEAEPRVRLEHTVTMSFVLTVFGLVSVLLANYGALSPAFGHIPMWIRTKLTKKPPQATKEAHHQVEYPIVWGTATAAYQVEGYRTIANRSKSVWDAFDTLNSSDVISAARPDGAPRVHAFESGAVADEEYDRYPESIALTSELGFGATRLSVSWTRVATFDALGETMVPNEAGLEHYRNVLKAYAQQNIKVALTCFHWDTPLVLEARAQREGCASAWLCDFMPPLFGEYVGILLNGLLGHREEAEPSLVAWWLTLNEPLTIVANGYSGGGPHAPGRCADRTRCYAGDDGVESYIATKNLILAHAFAFRKWLEFGEPGQGCGVTLNSDHCVPFSNDNADDVNAAERCLEWQIPLFFDPIFYGTWPASVDAAVAARLQLQNVSWPWTKTELDLVQDAHDGTHFFLNTYTSRYARAADDHPGCDCYERSTFACDARADVSGYNFTDGAPIGTPSTNGWLFNVGYGIRDLLNWLDRRYPDRTFVVTENGWGSAVLPAEDNGENPPSGVVLRDAERCRYYRDYVSNVSAAAVFDGVRVAAYFAWSLVDNFEWADGYSTRFGLVYVNFSSQVRTPKHSALYFRDHITAATDLAHTLDLPTCDDDLDDAAVDSSTSSMPHSLLPGWTTSS